MGPTGLTVKELRALEVLDSCGRPTLEVSVSLEDGSSACAGVPSGASTGSREAVELRDGDPSRFVGLGVLGAVGSVNGEIAEAICNRRYKDFADLDKALVDLDGTGNKSRLGANAVVGVSMATARAMSNSAGIPLWQALNQPGSASATPGAALQRLERRIACSQRSRFSGVHGGADRRTESGRGRTSRSGGLRSTSDAADAAGHVDRPR